MRVALLIVGAALLAIATVGWVIRRWLPETAGWIGMTVAAAVRLLAAVAIGWDLARISRHHLDALRLLVMLFEGLIGLWLLVSAAGMAYLLAFRRDLIDEPDRA